MRAPADAAPSAVGGKTLSHCKILEPLGSGGMGEVYRAHDTTMKRGGVVAS